MGMAASQARFLGLTARKSNVEYQGQQVNQQRTSLANESANLYNQMMALDVPVPPSKNQYYETVYTLDGSNQGDSTKSAYRINNVTNTYSGNNGEYLISLTYDREVLTPYTPNYETNSTSSYDSANKFYKFILQDPKSLSSNISLKYYDQDFRIQNSSSEIEKNRIYALPTTNSYRKPNGNETATHVVNYSAASGDSATHVKNYEEATGDDAKYVKEYTSNSNGAYVPTFTTTIPEGKTATHKLVDGKYVPIAEGETGTAIIDNYILKSEATDAQKNATDLRFNESFRTATSDDEGATKYKLNGYRKLSDKEKASGVQGTHKEDGYRLATSGETATHVCEYGPVNTTAASDLAGYETARDEYLKENPTGSAEDLAYFYQGDNGKYYFITKDDLEEMIGSVDAPSDYVADDIVFYSHNKYSREESIQVKGYLEETENGRYSSITIYENQDYPAELSGATYSITTSKIEDEAGYEEAFNEYEYEKALYDKQIQEINAQTEIIQKQDQKLELRLQQLETEQKAIATEMESVENVIKDNVEKTFNTFG